MITGVDNDESEDLLLFGVSGCGVGGIEAFVGATVGSGGGRKRFVSFVGEIEAFVGAGGIVTFVGATVGSGERIKRFVSFVGGVEAFVSGIEAFVGAGGIVAFVGATVGGEVAVSAVGGRI
jgi:hypothetical protein